MNWITGSLAGAMNWITGNLAGPDDLDHRTPGWAHRSRGHCVGRAIGPYFSDVLGSVSRELLVS